MNYHNNVKLEPLSNKPTSIRFSKISLISPHFDQNAQLKPVVFKKHVWTYPRTNLRQKIRVARNSSKTAIFCLASIFLKMWISAAGTRIASILLRTFKKKERLIDGQMELQMFTGDILLIDNFSFLPFKMLIFNKWFIYKL